MNATLKLEEELITNAIEPKLIKNNNANTLKLENREELKKNAMP